MSAKATVILTRVNRNARSRGCNVCSRPATRYVNDAPFAIVDTRQCVLRNIN